MSTLSVLLCTYNRPHMLVNSLAALLERTDERPDQLVVVNGGDERADGVVRQYAGRVSTDLVLLMTRNVNLAASRNVGLPHCSGDIVAMTDDDAEVFPDWVARMKHLHAQHPEAGAVGGPVLGARTASLVARVADLITFPSWPEPRYVRTLPGVNLSYKQEVVAQVGAQDESLFRGEDVDYNWRVQKLGYQIFFDPSVKVYHHHRPALMPLLHQHYMYGRAYYLVRRKWPEMYCVYPHALRKPGDLIKALNFIAAIFYEALLGAARMERAWDRVFAWPIMVANQVAWRAGMLRQKWAAL